MLTHKKMLGLQAGKHPLIHPEDFPSKEVFVGHLVHKKAYAQAALLTGNKSVLDIGCNTGYGCAMLNEMAKKVIGVDVSKKAIALAKKQYGAYGIEFKQSNGHTLPFDDNAFDVVVCFQVIEHVVDYKLFIDEIKRVIVPEGLVLFTTPNSLLRLDPGMKPWNVFHVREFDPYELESLLKQYFKHVSVLGLSAPDPLYSIQATAFERARKRARARGIKKPFFKRVLLNKIACRMLRIVRRILHEEISQQSMEEIKELCGKYNLDDLFYKDCNLDNVLDLIAICCNDEKTSVEAANAFVTKNHRKG